MGVAIVVDEPRLSAHPGAIVIVHIAITVVVDAVAHLNRTWVNVSAPIIAVELVVADCGAGRRHTRKNRTPLQAKAIAVGIGVEGPSRAGVKAVIRIVPQTIAVIVHRVAHFCGIWVDRRIEIVALLTCSPAISVFVPKAHRTVAVVVGRIGTVGLGSTWMKRGIPVVAVEQPHVCPDIPVGGRTCVDHIGFSAPAVAIRVAIPGGNRVYIHIVVGIVHKAVAVVVDLIADFQSSRVNRAIRIVAVKVFTKAIAIAIHRWQLPGVPGIAWTQPRVHRSGIQRSA